MTSRPHLFIEALEYRCLLDGSGDHSSAALEFCEVHPAQLASSDTSDSRPSIYLASVLDQETVSSTDYSVTIDWGDGTVSDGIVDEADGGLPRVFGDHEFGATGTYELIITVARAGIPASTVMTFVQVFDANPGTEPMPVAGDPWIVMSSEQVGANVENLDREPETAQSRQSLPSSLSAYVPTHFNDVTSIAVDLFQEDRQTTEHD